MTDLLRERSVRLENSGVTDVLLSISIATNLNYSRAKQPLYDEGFIQLCNMPVCLKDEQR